ncbi:hypothetical protein AcW2_000966 [Taiwanofungus camphoratus]|nr:hypothetical protein AcW2_000966 [Antrodia cinnamomea]
MDTAEEPPYYILVSYNPLLIDTPAPASTSLGHPVIEYHYADDSPHSLLPQFPGEHVLVLDFDPTKNTFPIAKSLSKELAVTGLKVSNAPGTGIAEEELHRNNKMHVLETTTVPEESVDEDDCQSPHAILARFKQRFADSLRTFMPSLCVFLQECHTTSCDR